ncbi:MAG: hypothetical protein ABI779_09270 [Acidobacteriota bacterium]
MNTSLAVVVSLLCAAIGFALFWFVAVPQDHGFFSVGDSAGTRLLLGFFATLLGVLLGSTYRQLARMKEANVQTIRSVRRFALNVVRSVDLWMGLVASPLVYGLLVQSAANMTLAGLVIVAIENGFCCLLIAENIVKRAPANAVGNAGGG